MIVYVVGYDGLNGVGGGGFDWHRRPKTAWQSMYENIEQIGATHFLWYREVEVGSDMKDVDITAHIQEQIIQYGNDGDF